MDTDERDLVARAKDGDSRALDDLLRANYSYVYGYLVHMTQNVELAKDLTQETLAQCIANLDRFRGDSKVSTWMVGISSNLYKGYLRKNTTHLQKMAELFSIFERSHPAGLGASGGAGLGVDGGASVEAIVEAKALNQAVAQAVRALPLAQRQAFVLKHMMGFSYEAISVVAKCPIGTVRSRLHHATEKLREQLNKGGWP